MATTYATTAPAKSSLKKSGLTGSTKSGHSRSRPVPLSTATPPPLVIAASKPRNPIAVDALLKKSGPHDDKRRSQKKLAEAHLRSGLQEVRTQNSDD